MAIVTALALTGGVAAPSLADYPSTWAEAQFWLTQNGYGPNQAVTIQVGSLSPGCDPFSGIVRISDVYVVRAGSVSAGGTLSDVSGQPNTFSSVLSGGAIMDEIIGITKPSGSMGSGDYDIVEDVCQNGRFDPDMDAILPNAFTVTIPSDIPNLPDPALQAIKTNAQQEWELWRTASPYLHLLGAAIIIGTLPEDGLDLAQEIIISGITWIMSCASVGDCQMNIGALELWNVFMQMAMISAAQASHYKGLAADPPSPDFAEPVTLGQPTSYQATPEDPLERAALDYMRALDESTRLTQGLLDAMERYQGAQLADDAPAALMQAQAGSALSNQLKAALTRENTAADALVAALNATGYNQATTISQIRTWQQRVAANGLSAADRAGLANLGFTAPGDEARFRQFVLDLPTDPQFANLAAMVSQEKTRNNAMNTALTTFGTAWDGLAATITDLVDDAAQTAYPTVTATVPASSVVGLAVSLAATATGDGAIDLTWDFDGDGHFDDATGMSVSFTPVRPGPQRVGVQACDGDGRCAITYTALDPRVVGGPPTVTATPANNTIQAVYVGDSLDLTAQFADTDGDTLNVAWLDGETAPVAPGTPPAVSEGGTLTVQGDASRRTRGVSAQATDPAGNMATARWTVLSFDPDDDGDGWTNPVDCVPDNPNINPGKAEVPGNGLDDDCDPSTPDAGPPVASFVTTPAIGIVGEPVTFTSTSTSPSGIRQYWWDLDGNGAWDTTSVSPSRTYTAPGLVPVNLTVRDNQGQGADATRNVRVTDRPVAAISASPGVAVPAGDTITLSSLSTDQDGGVASVEWDLDYNGASFFTETTTDNPQVVVNGPVTVALRVTDIYGAVSEIATVRLLTEGAPTAAFTSTPNGGQANLALPSSDASVVDYSSRYDSSRGPEQAIAYKADSNNGVYWRSAMGHTSGEWMIVDLGQEYELSAIALRTAYGNTGRIKDIRLSIGSDPDDPASFRPWVVDEFPNISQKVTWQAIDCGPVGRYVRLDVDSIWSGTDFYLAAFEVYSGQVGLADVQFTDHSVDPDAGGSIDAWYWSFGDGATSAEHNPHHVYPGPGIYTVTLTVQDAAGDQDTISGTYEVRVPLAASFTMVPAVAALGQEVVVTDTTLAPAGSSLASRSWDLDGNGTADSTANPARRSYAEPGLYSVTLTDITNTGQIGFASRDLRVTDRPVAEFTASAWEVAADKAVTLTDTSTDADGGVAAWEWDFDYDGVDFTTNSILQHPTYVPGHPVTVALRVTDVYGLVSEIVTHQIAVPGPPVPAFRSEATTGLVNVALDVHGASLVASSSQYSSSYAADIPIWWRGANPTGSWCTLTGSTGGWVVYDLGATYPLTAVALRGYSGTYGPKNVRVSLGTDPDDPDTFTPLVVGQLPQSAARAEWAALGAPAVGRYLRVDLEDNWGGPYTCLTSLEAMSGALGGPTVQLTDLSRDPDLGGAITAWAWDFGDGDTSAEQNPEHTYTEPGVYAVTLAATDSEGLTRTTTQRYEVKAPLAVPAFSVDVSTTSEGDRRRHTDNTVPTDRGVVTRTWVWGDGSANTVATANFVDHIWLDSGLLGVTLTVVDTYGLSASLIQTVSVANVAPVVSIRGQAWEVGFGRGETRVFAGISGQVMRNMVLAVTDAGSGDAATMLCTVDWGDGSPQHEAQPCYGQSLLQAVYHTYEQVGRYTVTITAVDKDGGTGRASTGLVVQPTSYLLVYPVTGTDFDGEVTVRVKLWDVQADSSSAPPWSQWFVVEGALVDVAVGDETWTVTTDANGEAEVRVSYALGDTVTAVFAGRPGVPAARDVNDLAQIGKPAVDIMILVDEGWWVADAQSALRNALPFLESQFGDSGVDYHIGLAGMASGYVPSPTVLEMPATTHLEDFALTTNLLDEAHGAALAVDSTVESFGPRFGFRPEAKQCVVPIFDEVTGHPQNDGAQAAALLAEHEATIFPIMTLTDKHVDTVNADAARAVLTELARDSGGQVFDLPDFVDDPEAVLGTVLAGCVSLRMQRADLAVTVTDDSDTTWAGASRTYSVTVRNDGEQDATGVRVELTLTGPQTVGAISHDGASVPGQDVGETVVTWSDLDILAGDQVVLTVERTVDSDAAVDSELGAAVTAQDDGTHGTDLTPANNQAADSTLVALATVIDLAVADDSKVYGEADPGFALTGLPAGWVEGTDYIVAFDREAGEDVGGYEITADVVILRAGHSLGTVDPGTLTITQRSLTATVGSADRVQTGLPVSAFLPVTFTGLRAGDTGSPNGTMVSGVLVGDYPSTLAASAVSVTRGGSPVTGNYAITVTQGQLTITPAVVDLAVADDSKVYGEADPEFALTGLPAGWVEGTDYTVAFDREAGENVGDYEITADVVILRAGHSLGTADPGTLTITQRSLTATVGSADRVQTGLPVSAFLPVTFTGLRSGDTGSPNGTMVSGVLVGDYPSTLAASAVSVTRGGSPVTGNYAITVTQGQLTILAAPVVVDLALADRSKIYGEADPSHALTGLPNGWTHGADYTVSFDREPGEDVGDYEITADVTLLRTGHTLGAVTAGRMTITQRPLTVTVGDTERSHTGEAVTADLVVTATGLRDGDTFSPATISAVGTNPGDYTSQLAAGDIQVTRDGEPVTSNYQIGITQGKLTILPASLELSVAAASKIYGEADPGFTLNGLPAEWTEGTDYTVSFNRQPGEDVGDYEVTADVTVLVQGQAVGAVTPGRLTIERRPVTVIASNAELVYTGQVQTADLPLTAVGLRQDDLLATTSTTASGTNVGDYTSDLLVADVQITRNGSPVSANYEISVTQGVLTIIPPGAVIPTMIDVTRLTVRQEAKVYGEADPPRYVIDGWPAGWTEADYRATFDRVPGEVIGSWTVVITSLEILRPGFELTGDISDVTGELTITPRGLTVTVGDATAVLTGGRVTANLPVTVSLGSLAAGDVLVTSSVAVTGQAVGDYPSTLQAVVINGAGTDRSANYEVTIIQGKLRITGGSGGDPTDDPTNDPTDDPTAKPPPGPGDPLPRTGTNADGSLLLIALMLGLGGVMLTARRALNRTLRPGAR